MIPVSKVVGVKIFSSPTFPARKGFGLLNIIGTSASLPAGDRIRFYSDMDGVAADFAANTEEYKAAQIFFSQSPKATELAISRRFVNAVAGQLLGGLGVEKNIATWNAIANGAFNITIDGQAEQVVGMDFSGAANLNAVATIIQTALQLQAAGSTCVWNGSRFILSSGSTGPTSTITFASAPGAGTDISGLMACRVEDLGYFTAGVAAESITASLNALQDKNQSWYGFMFTKEVTADDMKEAAAWAEARVKIFGYTSSASNIQDAAQTNDLASFFKDNGYDRTFGIYDDNDPYSVASAFARAFVVNFNEQNSTMTLKFKRLPGTTPVTITESQRLALTKKNINYYSYFGESAMLAEGVMASGKFFDEIHGLDWFQNAIETNVFGYLYTQTTKVPQTDKGVARLVAQVEKACNDAVNNGLLAPGLWNGADLGEVKSGDFLPKGFYIYAQPVAQQNQSDREARKAPPIQVIAKGAGAIHFVDISVTFER